MESFDKYIRKFSEAYGEAPVGKFNSQEPSQPPERIPLKDFIHLGAESRVLEAFAASGLPSTDHKKQFEQTLESQIKCFGQSPSFINEWHKILVSQLRGTVDEICLIYARNKKSLPSRTLESYQSKIQRFEQLLDQSFDSLRAIVNELTDRGNDIPRQYEREVSINIFENEHSRSKTWFLQLIRDIVGCIESAELVFKNANSGYGSDPSDKPGLQIATEFNRTLRYIKVTFSLQKLNVEDFLMLAFKFLHEYLSHLYACITFLETDTQRPEVDAHTKVCTDFKDGWLLHTIQYFCIYNLSDLLSNGEHDGYNFCDIMHIKDRVEASINRYIDRLNNHRDAAYSFESELGQKKANNFLNFLRECIGDERMNEPRINTLYYRLSCHLICGCPSDNFSQEKFMDCLHFWLSDIQLRPQLKQILSESIQGDHSNECINLGFLWSRIKDRNYELNLD